MDTNLQPLAVLIRARSAPYFASQSDARARDRKRKTTDVPAHCGTTSAILRKTLRSACPLIYHQCASFDFRDIERLIDPTLVAILRLHSTHELCFTIVRFADPQSYRDEMLRSRMQCSIAAQQSATDVARAKAGICACT
jgi:hypothetical protein